MATTTILVLILTFVVLRTARRMLRRRRAARQMQIRLVRSSRERALTNAPALFHRAMAERPISVTFLAPKPGRFGRRGPVQGF